MTVVHERTSRSRRGLNADASQHRAINTLLGDFAEGDDDWFVFLVRSDQRLMSAAELSSSNRGSEGQFETVIDVYEAILDGNSCHDAVSPDGLRLAHSRWTTKALGLSAQLRMGARARKTTNKPHARVALSA